MGSKNSIRQNIDCKSYVIIPVNLSQLGNETLYENLVNNMAADDQAINITRSPVTLH